METSVETLNQKTHRATNALGKTRRFLDVLGLPAGLFLILGLGRICSGAQHFFSHPIHQDDYQFLAFRIFDWHFPYVRPVSWLLSGLLAPLGYAPFVIALYAMLVLYAYLCLAFVSELFEVRMSLAKVMLLGILLCISPILFWYQTYLGLVTNLSSGVLGAAALYLFLRAAKTGKRIFFQSATLCLALSAFAKEDFVLPSIVFLLSCLLWRRSLVADRNSGSSTLWSLAGAAAILAAMFLYNRALGSPFTTASTDAYTIGATFQDIIHGFSYYLTGEAGTMVALFMALILAVAGGLFVTGHATFVIRTSVCLGILLAMVLPYAILPRHRYEYYCFMWYVWICSFAVVCFETIRQRISGRTRRIAVTVFFIIMIAGSYAYTFRQRRNALNWQENQSAINDAVLGTLQRLRTLIAGESVVGIYNPPRLSPWSDISGKYLFRVGGFTNRWIIFAGEQDEFYRLWRDAKTPETLITVLSRQRICEVPGMKIIQFDERGNGILLNDCHVIRDTLK